MEKRVADRDWRDIQACLDGHQGAYAHLVKRYEDRVAEQMWRFTRDRDVQVELVQEVFVEAYLSLSGFRGRAPFLHWLRRIATRVGYHYWKRQARELRQQTERELWQTTQPQADLPQTPSAAADFLHDALATLPPEDRLVLTLHYYEECNTLEIAELTGWSRALVKVRAFRARRKLRKLLEQAGFRR